jgi:hypothetical protein
MLFGMTSRFYGKTDPRPVWAMMNDFGIAESRMRGYWLKDTPVRTGHPKLLATTYLKPGGALIAIGSWSEVDEQISLAMDLKAMGLTGDLRVYAPAVPGLQEFRDLNPAAVPVPAGQGVFLRVQRRVTRCLIGRNALGSSGSASWDARWQVKSWQRAIRWWSIAGAAVRWTH